MKYQIRIFFLTLILAVGAGAAPTAAPVQSKEDVEFLSKADHKMIDLLETQDFAGIFNRKAESDQNLRKADLYVFKDISDIAMTKELCQKMLAKIYGPLNEISLKTRKIEIYTSHTGKTCEAQLDYEDSKAEIPERRTILGFVNAKPFAVVFKFSKKSTSAQQENVKKFWDSLR